MPDTEGRRFLLAQNLAQRFLAAAEAAHSPKNTDNRTEPIPCVGEDSKASNIFKRNKFRGRLQVESIAVTVYLIGVLKVDIRHERQSSPCPNDGY